MNNPRDEAGVKCPQCGHEFNVSISAHVPNEQRFSMSIESESPLLSARAVGEKLAAIDRVMSSVAKEIGGKIAVMIEKIEYEPHKLVVGFLTVDVRKERK